VLRLLAFVVLSCAAFAQDERRITSPNGQIEFRLFIAVQESNNLPRLSYEVLYRGQPLLKTSFMGLDIEVQEPLLGENVGLTSSNSTKSEKYNSLIAHYMQNGSLGRLIDVEARVYNDGVAFRYVIPRSTPLLEFVITEEATEFHFAEKETNMEFGPGKTDFLLMRLRSAWVSISGSAVDDYPSIHFMSTNPTTYLVRLDSKFLGTTPLTCPWRIISVGIDPKHVISATVTELNR
jgi:alpha-glucosidase